MGVVGDRIRIKWLNRLWLQVFEVLSEVAAQKAAPKLKIIPGAAPVTASVHHFPILLTLHSCSLPGR